MTGGHPTLKAETVLRNRGYTLIAGIDEAGRGALMGPVVAAAVILPEKFRVSWRSRVRDSKQLSPGEREDLFGHIQQTALTVGVGMSSNEDIDRIGIARSTRRAMLAAVQQLDPPPDYLIVDYFTIPETTIPHHGITRGDSLSFTIACASIIAKVTRDRLVTGMHDKYPEYGFSAHKGYGTELHLDSLRRYGPCPLHRRKFRPVRNVTERLV